VARFFPFEINRYTRPLPGLKQPLRLVHLSDLHVGAFIGPEMVRRWVEATQAQAPDLVVITGDLTDSEKPALIRPAVAEMKGFQAPLGVWAVWGNHDYRLRAYKSRDLSDLEAWLEASGVRVLENAGVLLREDFYLAGVDDFWHGRPDAASALEGLPDGAASLLLCHNPDYLFEVPATVGLTLCGHTHGGQIWIPFFGAVFTSSKYGKRFAEGWIEDPVKAFVSRGLGVSTLPLRYRCEAELVVLDLLPG
jgi:predicted MPP superfamily phosphohydrolase